MMYYVPDYLPGATQAGMLKRENNKFLHVHALIPHAINKEGLKLNVFNEIYKIVGTWISLSVFDTNSLH